VEVAGGRSIVALFPLTAAETVVTPGLVAGWKLSMVSCAEEKEKQGDGRLLAKGGKGVE